MAKRVDADRVIRLVARGAALVDVLPEKIYREEHLPSAINLPLATLRERDLEQLPRNRPIVLYCFDQH